MACRFFPFERYRLTPSLRFNHASIRLNIRCSLETVYWCNVSGRPKMLHSKHVWASVNEVALDRNVTLIPVRTNITQLDHDEMFWIDEFHGAALAATAHIFSQRFTLVSIASTYDIAGLQPLGSHPLLDPITEAQDLRYGMKSSPCRDFQKVQYAADWRLALHNLDVCVGARIPGALNCEGWPNGPCERNYRRVGVYHRGSVGAGQRLARHRVAVRKDVLGGQRTETTR